MTTHPFIASYMDRSECEQCGQPEDDPRHREPEPRELRESPEDFPRNVSALFESYGRKLL